MAKGDITGWVKGATMDARKFAEYKRAMFNLGHTYSPGGFSTQACPECGEMACVGLSVKLDGIACDEWIEYCLNCGIGWWETPLYEGGKIDA